VEKKDKKSQKKGVEIFTCENPKKVQEGRHLTEERGEGWSTNPKPKKREETRGDGNWGGKRARDTKSALQQKEGPEKGNQPGQNVKVIRRGCGEYGEIVLNVPRHREVEGKV